ncbi:helix-turn-helix domain-containing protein [Paenibacillus rhizovicinus]|uniref:Helix-turn-helix domain-containing protein n=1 Tax=Paenibacillus rhizovicinus TaxID=2704463 RepID=A0A6C0NXS7_9BACL|nr:AraC family transcriptional regulator [Paenibacillus rhizovicinus]QHW31017.1 helix-turn-helix domain-containing protein [Paenibacillus rhizovicinus]
MKLEDYAVAPYIRDSDYAIRPPFFLGERDLLDYIIFYVQEGTFELQVNGHVHRLQPGDLCLLQPGDIHTIRGITDTINPYVHLDFFYNPLRGDSFVTRPGQVDLSAYADFGQPRLHDCDDLRIPFKLDTPSSGRLRELVFKIIDCWHSRTKMSIMEANQLAHEFLVTLFKAYMKPQPDSLSRVPFLNWITSYLASRISEPINVKDMARRAGLSPSRFTVLFKQHFNITPYQYLMKLRIDYAQELLQDGVSLQQTSDFCGFTDVHHFSKTFKSAIGVNPGSYRRDALHGTSGHRKAPLP